MTRPQYETWHEMKVRFQREQYETIERLARLGMTKGDVAKKLGVPQSTITSFCGARKIKWSDMGGRRKPSKEARS